MGKKKKNVYENCTGDNYFSPSPHFSSNTNLNSTALAPLAFDVRCEGKDEKFCYLRPERRLVFCSIPLPVPSSPGHVKTCRTERTEEPESRDEKQLLNVAQPVDMLRFLKRSS